MEKAKVLFVDDEVMILNSIQRGIIGEDFKGFFATNGKKALEIMEENEIAVIVSDMRMPEMNGLELLKIVKEKYPNTIRMVLSGYAQISQIVTTINKAGIFKFILKPWKIEEDFLPAINEAIKYYQLQKESENLKVALEKKNILYQNLLKSSDKSLAQIKKEMDNFLSINEYVLNNIKKILKAPKNSITNDIVVSYINMTEEFYRNYLSVIFENNTSFTCEKLFSEIQDNTMLKKDGNIKLAINNESTSLLKGRYKLMELILTTILEKALYVYSNELNIVIQSKEVEENDEILLETKILLNYRDKNEENSGFILIIAMFLNELLKKNKGQVQMKEQDKVIILTVKQAFAKGLSL